MWLAPNMVTLLGFMWIVGNVFLIEIFMPDLAGPVSVPQYFESGAIAKDLFQGPWWLYFSFALGMWMSVELLRAEIRQG
jgi:ethanolaminephosphotransferase